MSNQFSMVFETKINEIKNSKFYFLSEQEFFNEFQNILLEISQSDKEKNKTLQPVFIVNTHTKSLMGNYMSDAFGHTYSHALISFGPALNPMYSFDFGEGKAIGCKTGLSIDNIGRYKDMDVDGKMRVVGVFVSPEKMKALHLAVDYYVKNKEKTKYGFMNLLSWVKGSKKVNSFGELKMFCSEFVDAILKSASIDITGKNSRNVTPDDFGSNKDKNNSFVLYEGPIKNFKPDIIRKKVKELQETISYKDLNADKSGSDSKQTYHDIDEVKGQIGQAVTGVGKYIGHETKDKIYKTIHKND